MYRGACMVLRCSFLPGASPDAEYHPSAIRHLICTPTPTPTVTGRWTSRQYDLAKQGVHRGVLENGHKHYPGQTSERVWHLALIRLDRCHPIRRGKYACTCICVYSINIQHSTFNISEPASTAHLPTATVDDHAYVPHRTACPANEVRDARRASDEDDNAGHSRPLAATCKLELSYITY